MKSSVIPHWQLGLLNLKQSMFHTINIYGRELCDFVNQTLDMGLQLDVMNRFLWNLVNFSMLPHRQPAGLLKLKLYVLYMINIQRRELHVML